MWLMHVYVFRPLLAIMDERSARMRADRDAAAEGIETAAGEERKYAARLGDIHIEATKRVMEGKREASAEHQQAIAAIKSEGARELERLRAELREQVKQQQGQAAALSADIKAALAKRLGIERPAA